MDIHSAYIILLLSSVMFAFILYLLMTIVQTNESYLVKHSI